MSDRKIRFRNGRFVIDGRPHSPSQLGRDVVATLLKGTVETDVGRQATDTTFGMAPDFIVEMLRKTGRTGEFHFDEQQAESPFDPAIDRAQELKEEARLLEHQSRLNCQEQSNRSNTLLLAADGKRRDAGQLYGDTTGGGPLSNRYSLPQIRFRQNSKPKRPEAIRWVAAGRAFKFGGCYVGPARLGRLIAVSLMCGCEVVQLGRFQIHINYLVEMARITGERRRFFERTEPSFEGYAPSTSSPHNIGKR